MVIGSQGLICGAMDLGSMKMTQEQKPNNKVIVVPRKKVEQSRNKDDVIQDIKEKLK